MLFHVFFFFKQKTAYEMRISDWSSDVCSSDLRLGQGRAPGGREDAGERLTRLHALVRRLDEHALDDRVDPRTHDLLQPQVPADGAGHADRARQAPAFDLHRTDAQVLAHTGGDRNASAARLVGVLRSEEHTSELPS